MVLSKVTQILQTQPILGVKFEAKSYFRGDFCIMTKMCLYFKTVVPACVHLHISEWPPGGNSIHLQYYRFADVKDMVWMK